MKKALLLFAALLVAGCGEKSSSEGSESASEKPTPSNESAEPSADTAKPPPADPPVGESPSEAPSDTPKSLSDADVERLLKEAVDHESLEERDSLYYQNNESEPFSGWVKKMNILERVESLWRFKDGKPDGLWTKWHENGQKEIEGTYKDGNEDGLWTFWLEYGQKSGEQNYKDGELISQKWWNNKGEEIETYQESKK